jgi:hypothetical protein
LDLGIAEPTVEGATRRIRRARFQIDLPDAGDPRRAFEPRDQIGSDTLTQTRRRDGEQQQMRLVVAVLHDPEADRRTAAHRECHIRRPVGDAPAHPRRRPAPAETLLDQVA